VAAVTAAVLLSSAVAVAVVHNTGRRPRTAPVAAGTAERADEPAGEDELRGMGAAAGGTPSAGPSAAASTAAAAPSRSAPRNPAPPAPGGANGSGPTAGLRQYTDNYKVQQPYDLAVSDRFSVTAGPTYNAWIIKGDKPFSAGSGTGPRTEMRWGNWSGVEHVWEADVLVYNVTGAKAQAHFKNMRFWTR
jgi:hypothetical protein